jgi:hypothetical protein
MREKQSDFNVLSLFYLSLESTILRRWSQNPQDKRW